MEQIITAVVGVIITIIASGGGLIVAYIESKRRKLEEARHLKTKNELTKERNGFREHVYSKLVEIDSRLGKLEGGCEACRKILIKKEKLSWKEKKENL